MIGTALAPLKVNLYLHVGPPRDDGFHPLSSLMVFADIGDRLAYDPHAAAGLAVVGQFADHAPTHADNLVARAAALFSRNTGARVGAFRLKKTVPAGAGLGGGSADAAAALRLLRDAHAPGATAAQLEAWAASLGSDIPACIRSRPVLASGRGDILGPAPALPLLPAVVLWPGESCATADVYRAFDSAGACGNDDTPAWPCGFATVADVVAWLSSTRNDLEAAAVCLHPLIGEALAALGGVEGARLARMSGSGSAVFALFDTMEAAARAAALLSADHPDWWVRACRLGGAHEAP